MIRFIGIDPGSDESGVCIVRPDYSIDFADKISNNKLLRMLRLLINKEDYEYEIAIESIQSYGMTMGKTTIETCYMIGRLMQAIEHTWDPELVTKYFLYARPEYGKAICGGNKINDSLIRSALEMRFGSYDKGKPEIRLKSGKIKQVGTPDGPLYKIAGATDKRSAYALCVYHIDKFDLYEEGK